MSRNKFSKSSLEQIHTLEKDLQLVLYVSIQVSRIDFGVSEGHRGNARQYNMFLLKKSKLDGYKKVSKHNLIPSMAADIFVAGTKDSYDKESLSYLAGVITSVAEMLYSMGMIEHLVRWGGNWDMDGEILIDQSFDDRPHIELIKPKKHEKIIF